MNLDAAVLGPVVRSAISKEEKRQFVAIKADALPDGPIPFELDGEAWEAHPVRSTLQARRVMSKAGADGRRVLLTSILDDELGEEVMARLAQRRVHRVEPWQLVRSAFDAQSIDPRVTQQGWMAQVLLENMPPAGYPPARSGILDLEAVWAALGRALGLEGGEPSIEALIEACQESVLADRWGVASSRLRDGFRERVVSRHGAAAEAVSSLLDKGKARSIVALGLIAEAATRLDSSDASRARVEVRLEDRHGLSAGRAELGAAVQEWCRHRVGAGRGGELKPYFKQAEDLASELDALMILGASEVHPHGFVARARQVARAVQAAVVDPRAAALQQQMEVATQNLESHLLAEREERCRAVLAKVRDARRLTRWLATPRDDEPSLSGLAARYRDEGAWVDRARYPLSRGHDDEQLQEALSELGRAVRERREAESKAFALRLQSALGGAEGTGDVLHLEDVYRQVVQPLAKELPVLVLVLDGMSQAVFQEVAQEIEASTSFKRMARELEPRWRPVIAPLPTVTEVARTSLLCGELTSNGSAGVERRGLEALAQEFGWDAGPRDVDSVFHKGTLHTQGAGLAPEVRAALDSKHRVVTVVVNAIDDQLPKGDQLHVRWTRSDLPEVYALLSLAEDLRRAVVLTADHGHVVELWEGEADANHDTEKGERWRAPGKPVSDLEVEVRGPRVLLPDVGGPAVLPWSERLRYCGRHAGYHGGASPQEVVVPLGVFVPENAENDLSGWQAEVIAQPWWWDRSEAPVEQSEAPVEPLEPKTRTKSRRETEGQRKLFQPPPTAETGGKASKALPQWLQQLMASEIYAAQKRSATRVRLEDEKIIEFLLELHTLGDSATFESLRNRLGLMPMRFSGLVSLIPRLLNVDGYAVLEVSQSEKTVRLDRKLLAKQFHLEEDGR